jgi:hypothetical protein
MPTAMPTVKVVAGNDEGSDLHQRTGIQVFGSNFPPGTVVNINAAERQGTARVNADGRFSWSFTVRPALECFSTVDAVVHGSDGIKVVGQGDVFCQKSGL